MDRQPQAASVAAGSLTLRPWLEDSLVFPMPLADRREHTRWNHLRAEWNLDRIDAADDWILSILDDADIHGLPLCRTARHTGTAVIWRSSTD